MGKSVDIFVFIDALGWEVIKNRDFLESLLPFRQPVKMQFGYSSTAIPTILTGQKPEVHKHLSFYYYAPDRSPFKMFKYLPLGALPQSLTGRWRVRHALSKIVAKTHGFTGYFEMYSMPFDRVHLFDYCEKTDLFVRDGLAPVKNLADALWESKTPHHISDWRLPEAQNIEIVRALLEKGDIEFAFLYTASMDGLLHRVTKDGAEITPKLDWFASKIRALADTAAQNYSRFSLTVFSDHGMTTTNGSVDVKKIIESTGLKFGRDYAAVYDSTMARIWFLNDSAREIISKAAATVPRSRVLSDEDKKRFGVSFPDNMFGELYILMDPGWQIEPSDMGLKALPGMHGYTPDHEDSNAAFLSTEPPSKQPEWVGDYFGAMTDKIRGAGTLLKHTCQSLRQ